VTDLRSLADVVRDQADRRPAAPCFEAARSGTVVTYGELADAVDAWRAVLGTDRPTVLLTVADPVALAVALVGVIAAGGRAVATDPSTPPEGLRRLVARLGAPRLQAVDGGASAVTALRIEVDEHGRPSAPARTGASAVAADPDAPPAQAPSSLLFTSGSSGQPKGVELSERRLLTVAQEVVRNQGLSPEDRGFNPLPLFHVNAQVVGVLATVVSGGALVLDARFHRTGFWSLLAERRITWLNAVPAVLAVLARTGAVEPPPSLRFIRSASAPLPDPVRRAFGDIPFVVSWGMTEAASQITATPPTTAVAPGAVGPPLATEVAVRDAEGAAVEPGVRGDLWIRGDGVVDGYLGGVAADRFDADGWLRTGDVGLVRDDGWVVVSGRADDVINRGGELVDPAEVEAVLLQDARVQEAAVVARASDILGQEAVALVVLAPGADRDGIEAALAAHAAANLPTAKRPVEIVLVDDLPRTAAGKVSRRRAAAAIQEADR
jgi:acyl-CoA synthetase (AMP-forming)/AMP-acid ligase II